MPSAAERTLVVLRHAKAEDGTGLSDVDRPLTDRGRRDAAAAGAQLSVRPDVVVCSPARRTVQTWECVREAGGFDLEAVREPAAYDASVDDLLDVVAALDDDRVAALLVGHNPGCEQLVEMLTGRSVAMPTCAYAVLRWSGRWADVRSATVELLDQVTPRG